MIPATQPHYALVRREGEKNATSQFPIVAWDDDGHGLVLIPGTSQLGRARDMSGFLGIVEDVAPVIAMAPGGGWLIEFGRPDGESTRTSPVVGWALRANGDGFALGLSDDGNCECAAELKDYRRIYHPDRDTESPAEP